MKSTYQTFRAGVDNADKHKTDREPFLCVGAIKISELGELEPLEGKSACDADSGLYCEEQEVHPKITT